MAYDHLKFPSTNISSKHMEATARLYRMAKAVLKVNDASLYGPRLDDLEIAVYLYEEALQWEIVRLHDEL